MSPDDELAALWHWLEPMCTDVPPPDCSVCSGYMELVPPEKLYYVCKSCFPQSFEWQFLEKE